MFHRTCFGKCSPMLVKRALYLYNSKFNPGWLFSSVCKLDTAYIKSKDTFMLHTSKHWAEVGLDFPSSCWEAKGQIQVTLFHKLTDLMMTSHKPSRKTVHKIFWCTYYLCDRNTFLCDTEMWEMIRLFFKRKLNLSSALSQQGWSFLGDHHSFGLFMILWDLFKAQTTGL